MFRGALAVSLLAATLVHASAHGLRPFPRFTGANCSRADFAAPDGTVRAELCRATSAASAGRAVVVLHGCGGFSTFDHRLATVLPADGIATLYVDYFGLTPPPGDRGFCGGPARGSPAAEAHVFSVWQRIVAAAGTALARTPGIASHRVGIVGWSLGGGLAVRAAEVPPPGRVFRAVAGFSTGSRRSSGSASLAALPPTLLLSGGRTDAIPLSSTLALYRAARAAGVDVSLFVYPHGSHEWPRSQGTIGIARAAAFLRAHL